MSYRVAVPVGVIRIADGKLIQRGMPEWREYLDWARKNTPLPPVKEAPSIEARRREVARRVHMAAQRAMSAGPTVQGHRWPADPASLALFSGIAAATANGMAYPADFQWAANDGTVVTLSSQQFRTLLIAMVTHVYQCKKRAYELIYVEIPASAEPESVVLDSGWPS